MSRGVGSRAGRFRALAPSALLFLAVAVGAGAALAGVSPLLLAPGAAVVLAAWDLAGFRRFLRTPSEARVAAGPLRRHRAALIPPIAAGILAAGAAMALPLRLPFAVMMLLVAADLACLLYALRALAVADRGSERPSSF
ncbi:MAG TPA: hypothetical protein VMF68_14240 [Spirochaetia bacterium]|nr:hypothetical protein [Spirochaetia bacterium]